MTGSRSPMRCAGVVVALAFAAQTTLLPAVHPCMAHDATGGHGHAAHGPAATSPMSHGGMDMDAAPAAGRHGDAPPTHDVPCTCADCACCSIAVTLPADSAALTAVIVAFVGQPAARARVAPAGSSADVLLPPAIGPPAARSVLT